MKKTCFLIVFAFSFNVLNAQNTKEINLNEVTVNASRIVNKANGMIIIPTESQRKAATNGYSMLGKLGLPYIRIDETKLSITALGNQGDVQIRINNVIATKEDMLAVNPGNIISIDFIDKPGVRYGEGIAYVINIITRRDESGYTVGADMTQSLTVRNGNYSGYAKINHKNSELGVTYNLSYIDFRGNMYDEKAQYTLNDGSNYIISRNDIDSRSRNIEHTFELKYNLADSASYVFQTSLSANFNHTPGDYNKRLINDNGNEYISETRNKENLKSPVADIYFFHKLGNHQSITANFVGTAISTSDYNYNDEGSPYEYTTSGNTWSMMSEAIYEDVLNPVMVSAGIRNNIKYTKNKYSGSVESTNRMHNYGTYVFGELKGHWNKFGYVAGFGISNQRYCQGESNYNYWLLRPKATISYSLNKNLVMNYSFEIYEHISKIAMISDTKIRENSREWTVGNSNLQPNRVTTNTLRLSYSRGRFNSITDIEYRLNTNPNLAYYTRTGDDQFLYTQKNQHAINMLILQNSTRYDIIQNVISLSAYAGVYRFFNYGENYTHMLTSYNMGGRIQFYFGAFTITANADNGWKFMEGETWNKDAGTTDIACSYHIGNCDLSIYLQHPFQNNPKINHAELVDKYIKKSMIMHSNDNGNMVTINFAWKLSHGKRFHDIQRKMKNKDTQTGIL